MRSRLHIASIAIAGVIFASGCSSKEGESGPAAVGQTIPGGEPGARVLVRVGSFRVDSISTRLSVPADIEAIDEADLYPEITGVIDAIEKREGDPVRRGEAVVLLAGDELRLTKETKELALEDARTKERLAGVVLEEARATVAQKQILVEQAEREHQRFVKLFEEEGLVSPEDLETKLYAKKEAEGVLLAAKLAVDRAAIDQEKAASAVKLAAKDLETAAFQFSRTVLRAPLDGVVSFLEHKRGELVSPSTKVFSVVSLERLEARMNVPQRELRRLRAGLRVDIECGVFPGRVFPGVVRVINPVIDKESGTVIVIVDLESSPRPVDATDADENGRETETPGLDDGEAVGLAGDEVAPRLRPGLFVDAKIFTATHDAALLVDKRAVLYDQGKPVIFLVREGLAHRCEVEAGFSSRRYLEVLGLETRPISEEAEKGDGDVGELSSEGGRSSEESLIRVDISRRRAAKGDAWELEFGSLVLVGQNKLKHATKVRLESERRSSVGSADGEE